MKKRMAFEGILIILLVFLAFIMYLMITNGISSKTNAWEVNASAQVSYIYPGDDGTLFTFVGNAGNIVCSINSDGNLKWKYVISDKWCAYNTFYRPSTMYLNYTGDYTMHGKKVVCSSDNGTLYLYIRENKTTYWNHDYISKASPPLYDNSSELEERLIAISSYGKVLWNVSLSNEYHPFDDVSVKAENNRVYVFNDYNETVFNSNGEVLFKIENISDPASVDENGNMYVVMDKDPVILSFLNETLYGYKEPSSIICAYDKNGTMIWQTNISIPIYREEKLYSLPALTDLPLYRNDTLYLPIKDGVVALGLDGVIKWSYTFNGGYFKLFDLIPVDSDGNVYIRFYDFDPNTDYTYINILTKNGTVIKRILDNAKLYQGRSDSADGTLYSISYQTSLDTAEINDLPSLNISALNMISGNLLWEYTIIPNDRFKAIITTANINDLMSPEVADYVLNSGGLSDGSRNYTFYPQNDGYAYILAGKDVVYIGYYISRYDWPVILNNSSCTYSGGIYAFDKKGSLIWEKPAAFFVSFFTENNDTLYYGTRYGALHKEQIDEIVSGIALVTIIYTIIRFFLIGVFSRSKDRIDKNENRNKIFEYIAAHPGLTLHEISRNININIGTTRYHLFILNHNHRIFTNNDSGKYTRYFINSSQYNKKEQFILSLLRRDVIKELLNLIIKKPGLSNNELSMELNLQKSTTSAYMNELLVKGIVTRSPPYHGKSVYYINEDYKDSIAFAIEIITSERK